MAMLIAGFGFLMVFVQKYGRSAVTATYLLPTSQTQRLQAVLQ
jgi:hypothetical protein